MAPSSSSSKATAAVAAIPNRSISSKVKNEGSSSPVAKAVAMDAKPSPVVAKTKRKAGEAAEEEKPKKKVVTVTKKVVVKKAAAPAARAPVASGSGRAAAEPGVNGIVRGHFGTSDASIGGVTTEIGRVYPGEEGQPSFTLTKPQPTRDPITKAYHFADYPLFTPNVSPEEIIRQGSFGGGYWRVITSAQGKVCRNDWSDLPPAWYAGIDKATLMTNMSYNLKTNKWKCKVGQTYDEWEKAGWFTEHDNRGWFHWYTRFWMGRRCADDDRQLGRWSRIATPASGRWRRIYYGKYLKAESQSISPTVEVVSAGIRQTLFHWAYGPSTADLHSFMKEKGVAVKK